MKKHTIEANKIDDTLTCSCGEDFGDPNNKEDRADAKSHADDENHQLYLASPKGKAEAAKLEAEMSKKRSESDREAAKLTSDPLRRRAIAQTLRIYKSGFMSDKDRDERIADSLNPKYTADQYYNGQFVANPHRPVKTIEELEKWPN